MDNLNEVPAKAVEIIKNEEKKESIWDLVKFAIIAILIVIPVRVFIAQPFIVSGASMFPTFKDSNYLIIDEISYRIKEPARSDVIVFRYPEDTKKFFIKRIIGLPNEIVKITGSEITIINDKHPEGLKLTEPYVKNTSSNELTYELKSDEYYVMGDNRSASSDSRFWGPVKKELIIGKAFLRLLPINNIGIFPGNYKQVEN